MTNTTAANGKEAAYHGVPAEDDYGYAQAIKIGNTIHVSGQLSQDDKGTMIAPAALDESGKPAEFSMMAEQMRVTYANPRRPGWLSRSPVPQPRLHYRFGSEHGTRRRCFHRRRW
jgi:hypothetical protein